MAPKSVSCRSIEPLNAYLEKKGIPLTEIARNLPVSAAHLSDPRQSLDWQTFVSYLEHFERHLGGPDELIRFGRTLARSSSPFYSSLRRLCGYFTDLGSLYWFLVRTNPILFRPVRYSYERPNPRLARITLTIPPEYAPSRPFFLISLGAYMGAPYALGQDTDALIHSRITDHQAVFDIQLPPPMSLFARLARAWRVLFAARSAIEELAFQAEEIRRAYEDQLKMQRLVIEQKVKLELATQLATQSKMLALGEMAGGIAHEINNPLAILSLTLGRLRHQIETGTFEAQSALHQISILQKATQRAANVIQGLLAFSGSAEQDPQREIPVRALILDTLNLCGERIKNAGVELILDPIPEHLLIRCRPAQISQVLLNLLNNSFDAIQDSPRKWIRIQARELGGRTEIAVEDSGLGIPAIIRDKLFQPFFTTKEIGKGVGLGLSISKGLVESNQGSIRLDPSSSHTRFQIELPS